MKTITTLLPRLAGALALLLASALTVQAHAQLPRSPAPEGATLYFIAPADGDVVDGTFTVSFGLKNMGVAPAGIDLANTGHHHLLINTDTGDLDLTLPLPATDQVRHFGGGQTETSVALPPGEHSLRLVLGNHLHIPHDPPVMSEVIKVVVQAAAFPQAAPAESPAEAPGED